MVWTCVIIIIMAQFAVTYLPVLQQVFGTQPVAIFDGMLIVAVGAVFFAVIESEKQLRIVLQRTRRAFAS